MWWRKDMENNKKKTPNSSRIVRKFNTTLIKKEKYKNKVYICEYLNESYVFIKD